ncbi:MAG TPA: tetratricopeptide repeat protein, partial [bacterium]|nr:tetratricopeptide repeat protein [bacterium]
MHYIVQHFIVQHFVSSASPTIKGNFKGCQRSGNNLCRRVPVLGLLLCLSFLSPVSAQRGGPADARELYTEGLSAQVQRNYTRAVELFRASLRVNPNYLEALVGLAESFYALEEYDESLIYVERANRFASRRLDLMILEGRIHLSLNDLNRAQDQFMMVVGLEKNNLEAQFGLAELDIALGRTQNAILRYQATLKIQPKNKKALLSLSLLSESQGANGAAESYLEQALKFHSGDPQVHFTAGRFALNREDLEHALVYLRTAISLDPDFLAAKRLLAQTYLLDEQGGKAVQFLREMLDIERNDSLAWYT